MAFARVFVSKNDSTSFSIIFRFCFILLILVRRSFFTTYSTQVHSARAQNSWSRNRMGFEFRRKSCSVRKQQSPVSPVLPVRRSGSADKIASARREERVAAVDDAVVVVIVRAAFYVHPRPRRRRYYRKSREAGLDGRGLHRAGTQFYFLHNLQSCCIHKRAGMNV